MHCTTIHTVIAPCTPPDPTRLIQLEMPADLLDGLLVQVVGVGAPVDVLVGSGDRVRNLGTLWNVYRSSQTLR